MKKLLISFIVLLLFNSCTSVNINNNWDKQIDFKTFKTYSFYPWDKQNDKVLNDYDKLTIVNAIKDEMNHRGYQFVEKNGDLVISVFVIVKEGTSYQAYTNHYGGGWTYGWGPGYYGYGYGYGAGYGSTTITSTTYQHGTLIVDIFQESNKKQVWQGIASGEVTQNLDKRDRRLPMRIGQLFRRFPVTPKSKKAIDKQNAGG